MERFLVVLLIVGLSIARVAVAWAESDEQWHAPFGGAFSAYFTAASDYSFAGISQTRLGPAIQVGLDYRTADLTSTFPVWLYLSAWGSNINFPTTGEGVELDLAGGVKLRALDRKLSVDLGYIRYLYPGIPASYGYEYGEIDCRPTSTGTGRSAWSPAPTASTSRWPTPTPASTRSAAASRVTARGASSSA